jgi:hypothetical protein
MKKARARCPQLGNNLWTEVHPPGSKGPCSVYRAGSPRILEEPQHRRHLGCSRLSSPSRGGAGSGPSGGTACASRTGGRGGLVKGRASTRKRWLLQPAHPRARDRRCLSNTDRDNGQSSTRPSRVDVMPGRLCGESRSGPEPWKLCRRGVRKDGRVAGDMLGEAKTSLGMRRHPGSRSSGVVLVDRIGRKQGALGRESALPLTGWRAEAVLVLPLSVGSQIP